MNLFWSHNPAVPNFGDDINPMVFLQLFGKPAYHVPSNYRQLHYVGIGSVLHHANSFSTIAGTGFIQDNDTFIEPPARIISVRGRETRKELLRLGVSCPEIYGDPALLLPHIYHPQVDKKYLLGIIPHFIDKNIPIRDVDESRYDIKIIDIQNTNHLQFIRDVLSCRMIASSSLHGMIIADAYGIPSAWLEFSDNVIGNGFKFRDHFSAVGTEKKKPIRVKCTTTIEEILNEGFTKEKIQFDYSALLKALRDGIH